MKKILLAVAAVLVSLLPIRWWQVQRAKAAEQVRAERFADDQARSYRAAMAEMRRDQQRQAENERILDEVREGGEKIRRMGDEALKKLEEVREQR